jgi:hypothetical protein
MEEASAAEIVPQNNEEIKGNGNFKGIKRTLSCSDDEDGFRGFDLGKLLLHQKKKLL